MLSLTPYRSLINVLVINHRYKERDELAKKEPVHFWRRFNQLPHTGFHLKWFKANGLTPRVQLKAVKGAEEDRGRKLE